ncbi:hypothetical protein MRB53_026847 [Persea americana]|uniref:Uncharacterized protein n=1 Tax=Persea americana TaxID=3435 RepID=A0ACC2LJB3_PERAE|nr:hypothetical protein MRB53_026847 [Persea americana]
MVPNGSFSFSQEHSGELLKALNHTHLQAPGPPIQEQTWVDLFPNTKPLHPSSFAPSTWKEGNLTIMIPAHMIETSRDFFAHLAIGRFGKRPTIEWVEQHVQAYWNFSRPCLISLTEKGYFLFRFNSGEDKDHLL